MTSFYQLVKCSLFVTILLLCHSLVSFTVSVPYAMVLQSNQVEDRKVIGRDMGRFQKKKEPKVLTTPAFSATLTRLIVQVTPKNSTLPIPPRGIRLGEELLASVNIRCRIKCIVEKVQDLPTISFCLQIGNETILPLTTGLPGVDLFTASSDSRMQRPYKDVDNRRAVPTYRLDVHLTLNSNAYPILQRGKNQLFCRASSPAIGLLKSDGFLIYRQ